MNPRSERTIKKDLLDLFHMGIGIDMGFKSKKEEFQFIIKKIKKLYKLRQYIGEVDPSEIDGWIKIFNRFSVANGLPEFKS